MFGVVKRKLKGRSFDSDGLAQTAVTDNLTQISREWGGGIIPGANSVLIIYKMDVVCQNELNKPLLFEINITFFEPFA